jgi:pantothenate kinase-related protein Tda10
MMADVQAVRGHAKFEAYMNAGLRALQEANQLLNMAMQEYHEDQDAFDKLDEAVPFVEQAVNKVYAARLKAEHYSNPHHSAFQEVEGV